MHNHFHDSTVIFNEGNYIEEKLESAEACLTKLYDYEKARKLFEFVTENSAGDYRGWWGIVRVLTKQFTFTNCTESEYEEIKMYYKKAISVARKEQKKQIESVWTSYSQKVERYIENNKRISARKNRNKHIRLSISIVLSLVCNIYVIAFAFTKDMEKYATTWSSFLTMILILFGVNVISTTLLGLIGSTKVCSAFPAISAAIFLGVFVFQSFKGISFEIISVLFFAVILICALAIVAVCYIIPTSILNRFVNKK